MRPARFEKTVVIKILWFWRTEEASSTSGLVWSALADLVWTSGRQSLDLAGKLDLRHHCQSFGLYREHAICGFAWSAFPQDYLKKKSYLSALFALFMPSGKKTLSAFCFVFTKNILPCCIQQHDGGLTVKSFATQIGLFLLLTSKKC